MKPSSSKRARLEPNLGSDPDSDDESLSNQQKPKKSPSEYQLEQEEGCDAAVGSIKCNNSKINAFLPIALKYSKVEPTANEVEEVMLRIGRVTDEVLEISELATDVEFERMKQNVHVLEIAAENVTPFVFPPTKHIVTKPPVPKCQKEVLKTHFFVPLSHNVRVEDEPQLSNLPLMDNDQHDISLQHHVNKVCRGGVHGAESNIANVSEEQLFMIMRELLQNEKSRELLYYGLYKSFINIGTQEQFSKMFPKLRQIYDKNEDMENRKHRKKPRNSCRKVYGPINWKPLGQNKKVYTKRSKIAGIGLWMGEHVDAGEFICEYTGEHCSKEETERRGKLTLLGTGYVFGLPGGTLIDAERGGNAARFINQSKTPNTYAVCDVTKTRVLINAREPIPPGTELTLDYGYDIESEQIFMNSHPADRVPKVEMKPKRHVAPMESNETKQKKRTIQKRTDVMMTLESFRTMMATILPRSQPEEDMRAIMAVVQKTDTFLLQAYLLKKEFLNNYAPCALCGRMILQVNRTNYSWICIEHNWDDYDRSQRAGSWFQTTAGSLGDAIRCLDQHCKDTPIIRMEATWPNCNKLDQFWQTCEAVYNLGNKIAKSYQPIGAEDEQVAWDVLQLPPVVEGNGNGTFVLAGQVLGRNRECFAKIIANQDQVTIGQMLADTVAGNADAVQADWEQVQHNGDLGEMQVFVKKLTNGVPQHFLKNRTLLETWLNNEVVRKKEGPGMLAAFVTRIQTFYRTE